jgi:hypothetical protein
VLGLRQTALLADAADVLSEQLYAQLMESARQLGPRIAETDRRFLKGRKGDPRIGSALLATTAGAAFRLLEQGATISSFFEQVEYNGRRLAKLNLPPAAVVAALEDYARLLGAESNQHWMVQQLHFCVILTLNNAFYQVREAETKVFYDLFRIELESRTLDDLLSRVLVSLAEFCGAAKARVFLLEGEGTLAGATWQLRAEVRGGSG